MIAGSPNMPNALLTAIKTNDYQAAYDLIYQNPETVLNVNFQEDSEEGLIEAEVEAIPLCVSLYLGHRDITQLLLEAGADPNLESFEASSFSSPLEVLLRSPLDNNNITDHLETITLLFHFGVKIEDKIIEDTVFACRESFAVGDSHFFNLKRKVAEQLYACKIYSEFLYYVRSNNLPKVEEYLTKTHVLADKYSPIEVCSVVIDPNIDCGLYGMAVFHAASLEDSAMLDLLNNHGADLWVLDGNGFNILHYASRFGSVKNIRWILSRCQEIHGDTSILLNGQDEVDDNTPLHLSAQYEHFFAVEALLEHKANSSIKNKANLTAVKMSSNHAIKQLFDMFKEGFPSLAWLCAKQIAEVVDEIPAAPQPIQALIFMAKTGEALRFEEDKTPPTNIDEAKNETPMIEPLFAKR